MRQSPEQLDQEHEWSPTDQRRKQIICRRSVEQKPPVNERKAEMGTMGEEFA